MTTRGFFVVAVAMLASMLSGCFPASDEGNGRLAPSLTALIDQALAQDDLSDWDRAALEKASAEGQISQADYVEGMDLFDACLKSAGIEFTRTTHLNGVIEFQPPPGQYSDVEIEAQGKAQYECSVNAVTQEIFRMQQANPDLLTDFPQAVVNCLKKAGVVDDEFTKEDFENVAGSKTGSAEYPFDVMDPEAQTCLYSLGYTVKVVE
ncbi:MAG: hypothetical protein U1E32_07910 [Rhodoglobus sp.]|nr:hypothetical protein [Rhodoglobus sp.]